MTDTPLDEYGPAFLPFKVRTNSREIDKLKDWRSEVDKERERRTYEIRDLTDGLEKNTAAVQALRSMLLKFSLSITGSAIVFAMTVLIATGKV